MEQRNMMCPCPMHDLNVEQFQSHHFLHEPELGALDNLNGGVHSVLPSVGPVPGIDVFNCPENHECSMVYRNQHNIFQHSSAMHLGLGGSVASNSYNPYLVTCNVCPFPANHGSSEHLPSSSSHHRLFGVSLDEFGRNNQFTDNGRSCKRKNAEGGPCSIHRFFGPSAGSSSSSSPICGLQTTFSGPVNTGFRPWDKPFGPGNSLIEAAASFNLPDHVGGGNLPTSEDGSQRSVRSRSNAMNLQVGLGLTHHHGQVFQGNYMDRSVQPLNNGWVEHYGTNAADSGNTSWNYAPPIQYMPGINVGGNIVDIASMNSHGYPDATANMNPGLFNPPSMQYPVHYDSPVHNLRERTRSLGYPSQIIPPAQRNSTTNFYYGNFHPSRDALELVSRHPRSIAFSGDRNLRSNRRVSLASQGNMNDRRTYFPSEDVAFLDYSGHYEVGSSVDQHQNMRMDIDEMSYEELLALEERIGDVSTGLSEEAISTCLKTRLQTHSDSASPSRRKGMQGVDQTCAICQVEFDENEKIGTLDCGHEYHADCIRQWLLLKNLCPVCKVSALTPCNKD